MSSRTKNSSDRSTLADILEFFREAPVARVVLLVVAAYSFALVLFLIRALLFASD